MMNPAKDMTMNDLHLFIANLAGDKLNGRRTFGPLSLSVLNTRRYKLVILLDTDLKNDPSHLSEAIKITSTKDLYMRFPKTIIDRAYTIATTRVTKERLAELSQLVNGTLIDQGIVINGVTFSTTDVAEERFLDDLLRMYALKSQLSSFEEQKPLGGIMQMTLISPFDLAPEKMAFARKLLFDLVKATSEDASLTEKWLVSVIHTDFVDSATFNPVAYSHARFAKMAPSMEIVTSRFGETLASQKKIEAMHLSSSSEGNGEKAKHTLGEKENLAPIGLPRKIEGNPLFHFMFWTIVFMIAVLIWVSIAMWNMKTYEDPLLMFTEYVLDQDSSIMEDDL